MYIKTSFDDDFEDLIMYLRSKYSKELFNLEGIGKQTDMGMFSKAFFSSKSVSDFSIDANANVDDMSIIAYENELPKPYFRLNSLYLLWKYTKKLYSLIEANKVVEMQLIGDIYINDLCNVQKPYCYNFSTYDVMTKGLPFVKKVDSNPPKHLSSFIGQMIHFTSFASNAIMGAVGLADLLIVMSYYVDKEVEDNPTVPVNYLWKQVKQEVQSLIYSCNQPFRGGLQSGFYNVSVYDDEFLTQMCADYIFPNGKNPNKDTVNKLQELYLDLMNETLEVTPATFPVTTACFSIDDDKNIKDKTFLKFIAEKNKKFAFINIYAGKSSTLSSCCRLRSDKKNEYFNSFGSGSSKIGSFGVVSVNIPRLAIKAKGDINKFFKSLEEVTEITIKINRAKRHILEKRIQGGSLPLYTLGFMDLSTQYSTIGVIGLNEACEFMGLHIMEESGQKFVTDILNKITDIEDTFSKKYKYPMNMEQVPAENSSIKLASKDKLLNFQQEYALYSNQFIPLIVNADLLDRIKLQGMFDSKMSGGAIAHLNIESQIEDATLIEDLITVAVKAGVVYHALNYNLQRCSNRHMTVGRNDICPICGEPIEDNFTRVVGFLVNLKNFHKVRREVDYPNRQFYKGIE